MVYKLFKQGPPFVDNNIFKPSTHKGGVDFSLLAVTSNYSWYHINSRSKHSSLNYSVYRAFYTEQLNDFVVQKIFYFLFFTLFLLLNLFFILKEITGFSLCSGCVMRLDLFCFILPEANIFWDMQHTVVSLHYPALYWCSRDMPRHIFFSLFLAWIHRLLHVCKGVLSRTCPCFF